MKAGDYLAGDYSIADIASFAWVCIHKTQHIDLNRFPSQHRWHERILRRDAVQRGLALAKELRLSQLKDQARKTLLGPGQR